MLFLRGNWCGRRLLLEGPCARMMLHKFSHSHWNWTKCAWHSLRFLYNWRNAWLIVLQVVLRGMCVSGGRLVVNLHGLNILILFLGCAWLGRRPMDKLFTWRLWEVLVSYWLLRIIVGELLLLLIRVISLLIGIEWARVLEAVQCSSETALILRRFHLKVSV